MEYSEEENKAIEYIEECKQKNAGGIAEIFKSSCVLKELVEKQQKEIEDIYRLNGNLDDENNRLRKEIKEYIEENYISKEAIREILNKYEHIDANEDNAVSFFADVKELLGE